jgi:integrase
MENSGAGQQETVESGANSGYTSYLVRMGRRKWTAACCPYAPQKGAMKFTVKEIAGVRLPAGSKDFVWWDDEIAGFGIRLREGGSRTWIYRYRRGSKQRSMKLGSAKSVPLSVARENASKLEAEVRLGGDPALKNQTANLAADNTFGVLANQYLEARKSKWRLKSYAQSQRHLLKYAKPLHRLPITAVSQRNIANLLSEITKDSGEATSNRLRSTLCSLFSWVIKEGIRLPEGNVASYTNKHAEKSRERVLTDGELKTIWRASPDSDFGAIIKLLILTGQRANEIGGLRWEEVHDEQIVLPSLRTKNKRTHVVALSDAAKTILGRFSAGARAHIFGRADTIGFDGWGFAKRTLDARIAEAGKPLEPWVVHDIRRTVATRMAELGVQPHIIEAVLNHVSGHKGGIAGIYNRATYDKEKREALNLWAEHVMATVEGRAAKVTQLKRA